MTRTGIFLAGPTARAVAATGLEGSRLPRQERPLTREEWDAFILEAKFHRITGLVAAAIDDGSLPTDEGQTAEAHAAHVASMELCVLLEGDLLHATTVLDAGGIEHRVLKGSAFAHLDYPDPSLRAFADVDLLVRSDQYDAATTALMAAGYIRRSTQLRAGFDRRFGKGASFAMPDCRHELDLHRTLVMGPYGLTVALDDLWASSTPFWLGDRLLTTADADIRFLHACFHAAIGNARTRIVPLRDLAGMLQRASDPVDIDRARAIASRWRADAVLSRAIALAWDAFALEATELSGWADSFEPDRRDERALASYLDLDMGFAARSFTALRALPRWRDKVAFGFSLSFPDRAFGAGRHRDRQHRWRSAARQIRSLKRRTARR